MKNIAQRAIFFRYPRGGNGEPTSDCEEYNLFTFEYIRSAGDIPFCQDAAGTNGRTQAKADRFFERFDLQVSRLVARTSFLNHIGGKDRASGQRAAGDNHLPCFLALVGRRDAI